MKGCIPPILLIIAVIVVFTRRHDIIDAFRGEPTLDPTAIIANPPESDETIRAISGRVKSLLVAEMSALDLKLGDPIYLRIFKESRELEVWVQGTGAETFILYKTFVLCPGSESPGPPTSKTPQHAPEGFYYVAPRALQSNFRGTLALDLGYPNSYDRIHGHPGRAAHIQGSCRGGASFSLSDREMEELYFLAWHAFQNGQPFFRVHCFPFRMTDERMDSVLEAKSEFLPFWSNLKEGFDYFDILSKPPNTTLADGRYFFQ